MVPKTSSPSTSKTGASAGASSSSAELFNNMNRYVISKIPDQSNASKYVNAVMRKAIGLISQEIGWNGITEPVVDVLTDLTAQYLTQLAKQSKKYTDHYGRTQTNEDDVALAFEDMNISIPELEEYVQNFDPVPIPHGLPRIPLSARTDLSILRPGSDEILTRPLHVHEYMPSMIFIPESEELDLENVKEETTGEVPPVGEEVLVNSEVSDELSIVNGMLPLVLEETVPEVASELIVSEVQQEVIAEVEIKTENVPEVETNPEENKTVLQQVGIVENDLEESSDDEIEPATSKAASIFATFKSTKKLESASENATLNRIRKMLAEHGHPVRENTSVTMTSSGFITEFREGRMPDTKPPSFNSFFDPPSPPPKEPKKTTTMKKILQGVKKVEKGHSDSEGEINDGPGLFGVMDKIVPKADNGTEGISKAADIGGENGVVAAMSAEERKLAKLKRKQLQKERKELKAKKKLKMKSKEKILLKAKSVQAVAAIKELDPTASSASIKSKLAIFSKKSKSSKGDLLGSSPIKKKKKDKKNKFRLKDFKLDRREGPLPDEVEPSSAIPVPNEMENIESDEDFLNSEGGVVSPVRIRNHSGSMFNEDQQKIPFITKKIKRDKDNFVAGNIAVKMKAPILNLSLNRAFPKKLFQPDGHVGIPGMPGFSPTKAKIPKRPFLHDQSGEPPMKKKRGRPKKITEGMMPMPSAGVSPGNSMQLPESSLANIGKSLMMNEQSLKTKKRMNMHAPLNMKIRAEHMEIQNLAPAIPPMLTTKPPSISPSKLSLPPANAASLANAELLKRLPAQPGLIPDIRTPPAQVRLPKELPPSISITPAVSSPQKEMSASSSSKGFPGALPSSMCSSVTITRIHMNNQQKLPSPHDDSVTPGIGPPPGLEGPHKRNKLKGVPPPPPLQIPMQAETESGITITPILMGGMGPAAASGPSGGNKELRFDDPLPPPPPLQQRPPPLQERPGLKHSLLAKLDEELSSAPPTSSSSPSGLSKEQRRKDKEKRKEMKKEKKKKAKDKDKSKDKSEKKKKKKDKSGESASGGEVHDTAPAIVPKITLKLGGHSNTTTPVDSPNPPQVYHDPPHELKAPPPLKKFSIKHFQAEEKPPKQKVVPLPPMPEDEDLNLARFAPLVTRPQKPQRVAKAQAALAVTATAMGAAVNQQEIPIFPSSKESKAALDRRGRGRPPKGGVPSPVIPTPSVPPSTSKTVKASVTALETETVGCIIDEQGNKVWICPACGRQDDGSPMIGCDLCDDWYHFACMGIEHEPAEEEKWFCPRCTKKKGEKGKKKRK